LLGCSSEPLEPKVFYTEQEAATARALLAEVNPDGRPVLVVVSRNSGGQRTGWHDERWIEVLRYADAQLGYLALYAGVTADQPGIERLRAASGVGVSMAGRTTVPELAAMLACSDLMISLDTGTMHVGRSTGIPMTVLGPSWQKPHEWLPMGKEHVRILRGEDRIGVPEGYLLDEISAASAIEALEDLAARYPASAEARERRLAAGVSDVDLLAR
jgi:ADP-heptose:LPS heptosyltransferase